MKVIVAGGRDFINYDLMREKLDFLLKNYAPDIEIVCGEALGADSLGKFYAQRKGYNVLSIEHVEGSTHKVTIKK